MPPADHVNKTPNTTAPAMPRSSGRTPDPTSQEGIFKRAKTTITTIQEGGTITKAVKTEIVTLLEDMMQRIQQSTTGNPMEKTLETDQTNTATARFDSIEQKIEELKTMITTERTWAQVAASSAPTNTTPQAKPTMTPEKRLQLEEARKERARYEVTLTANSATEEVKNLIAKQHPKEIKNQCQKAIEAADTPGNPTIIGINKLAKDTIRLQLKTPDEAEQLRKAQIDWNIAYNGLKPHKPRYGIVVHRVKTEAIDLNGDHTDTIRQWEEENKGRGIKISKITTLRRVTKHKPTVHRSLIVFTEDLEAANRCLKLGFIVESTQLPTAIYAPHMHINQCYKCYGYGYRASFCKKNEKCGHCGKEDHTTPNCTATEHHCVNCKGAHEAWHVECPTRTAEATRLSNMRVDAPSPFFV